MIIAQLFILRLFTVCLSLSFQYRPHPQPAALQLHINVDFHTSSVYSKMDGDAAHEMLICEDLWTDLDDIQLNGNSNSSVFWWLTLRSIELSWNNQQWIILCSDLRPDDDGLKSTMEERCCKSLLFFLLLSLVVVVAVVLRFLNASMHWAERRRRRRGVREGTHSVILISDLDRKWKNIKLAL